MSPPLDDVATLFIGGCQRSGSTLLDRLLSQAAGHVSAGEIVHLVDRGLRADEPCGCGEAFSACPFWTEVGRVGFGGWDRLDAARLADLRHRVDRNRYIFFMLCPFLAPAYRRDLHAYAAFLGRLYRAIGAVGGGAVVDSSKHASTAYLLRRVPSVRMRVVHLVRDSRGVAYSLLKRVPRPETGARQDLMHRAAAWRSGAEWLVFNALFELLGLFGVPRRRVRYEDLVGEPAVILEQVTRWADGTPGDLGFVEGRHVKLGVAHTVAGNPMRFTHGEMDLRLDDIWEHAMTRSERRIVTAITWPLLRLYGYRSER